MLFNPHSNLEGQHALLSASSSHWLRYSEEKLAAVWSNLKAAQRGTELHAFAHEAIRLGIKQADDGKTLSLYVNDCIGFRMACEQVLYYSDNCFGTPDAISFRKNVLRIFDLKTGVIPAKVEQLEVYAALFCLEYKKKPTEIEMDLRIYQSDEVVVYDTDPDVITHIMDRIVWSDQIIEELKSSY